MDNHRNIRAQIELDERIETALLSRLVLAGLSQEDATDAARLLSSLVWIVVQVAAKKTEAQP